MDSVESLWIDEGYLVFEVTLRALCDMEYSAVGLNSEYTISCTVK